MIDLKNNRGAITLYIIVVVLFFIIALGSVQANLKTKEARVETEYQKIKASYTKDASEVYASYFDDIIEFTIEQITGEVISCYAKEGMTWEEWIESTYNSVDAYIQESYTGSGIYWIYVGDDRIFKGDSEMRVVSVTHDNEIIANGYYGYEKQEAGSGN